MGWFLLTCQDTNSVEMQTLKDLTLKLGRSMSFLWCQHPTEIGHFHIFHFKAFPH